MKKYFTLLSLTAALLLAGCQEKPATTSPKDKPTDPPKEEEQQPAPSVTTPAFAKGADISWVSEMEAGGKKFRKQDGTASDILDVLKEAGVNAIRLRVWVRPEGGWSGKADVVKLAVRATKAGLPVMIDFHYSDFFADPSRQKVPADWEADKGDLSKMAAHVSDHTKEVLQALKEAGVTPAWVQVGNETRAGMLFGCGDLAYSDKGKEFARFITLYNAGYEAVKSVFPKTSVMPHIDKAFDKNNNLWWLTSFKSQGGKFDMIALSHYPQESWNGSTQMAWETANAQALSNIQSLISTFNVPVIISEVGVKTPADETLAAQVLSEFMTAVQKIDRCAGVFYWEPEVYGGWKPAVYGNADAIYRFTGKRETWNGYGMGAFTSEGKASKVLNAFK